MKTEVGSPTPGDTSTPPILSPHGKVPKGFSQELAERLRANTTPFKSSSLLANAMNGNRFVCLSDYFVLTVCLSACQPDVLSFCHPTFLSTCQPVFWFVFLLTYLICQVDSLLASLASFLSITPLNVLILR